MKKILIPTDFSPAARNAALYAVELAKSMQCELLLYHAYVIQVAPATEVPWVIVPDLTDIENDKKMRMEKEIAFLSVQNNTVKITSLITVGVPVDEILNLEKAEKVSYIVMGMKKSGALREFIVGSVATQVIRKSEVPVIVVPEDYSFKKIIKIAFASDYNIETDTSILQPLKDFSEYFNSQLLILNVTEKKEENLQFEKAAVEIKMDHYFEEVEHTFHFSEDSDLMHGLNEFIKQHQIDMVVTVSHQHNLLERIFRKNNNKKIAFHTPIPLLTIPDTHKKMSAYFV
ncbi:MAG: universal stress protein [Bacteroidota bacterium]